MLQQDRYEVTTLSGATYLIDAYNPAHAASRATVHLITQRTKGALIVKSTRIKTERPTDIPTFDAVSAIQEIRLHYWGVQAAKAPETPHTHPSFADAH